MDFGDVDAGAACVLTSPVSGWRSVLEARGESLREEPGVGSVLTSPSGWRSVLAAPRCSCRIGGFPTVSVDFGEFATLCLLSICAPVVPASSESELPFHNIFLIFSGGLPPVVVLRGIKAFFSLRSSSRL